MTINELFKQTVKMNFELDCILKDSGYQESGFIDGVAVNTKDSDELQLFEELREIMEKLSDVNGTINYLRKTIVREDVLHRNTNGRYQLSDGTEYTCGCGIEALIPDEFYESPCWVISTVEYNGTDYYLVQYPDIPLEGLKVRIRSRL